MILDSVIIFKYCRFLLVFKRFILFKLKNEGKMFTASGGAVLQVDVPLEVVHLTDEYWERVVSSFFVASFWKCE